jgi:Na+-translocating ferredoxin:NAD+ oxidoreductase RNF subunit RnfB
MGKYEHSVTLDVDKCTGCTTCVRHCPTEAIRVRDGHAHINNDRCIDCGVCISICPHKAKRPTYTPLDKIPPYKYKIALPAPSLYGQFSGLDDIDYIIQGLYDIGFDDVFEVSAAAELVSAYTRMYMSTPGIKKPVISSACPVIVRLITLRFPFLRDNIMPMLPPMEIAAVLARQRAKKMHPELRDEDIGTIFISPCPAKVSYIRNGFAGYKSAVDCVVSIADVYFALLHVMKRDKAPIKTCESGALGIGWASSGGESTAIFNDKYLATDGIENVVRVLDQIENGNIQGLEFIELNACPGGCVGGTMTIENPFIAKARLLSLRRYLPITQNAPPREEKYIPANYFFNELPNNTPFSRLSDNLGESMHMMAEIERIRKSLPGIDCGACGAPTCRAFAEDLVCGTAQIHSCVVMMRQAILEYASDMNIDMDIENGSSVLKANDIKFSAQDGKDGTE